mmetsp:Transcript_7367/g.19113  ORF Transcript_7367/g.19113 Transcript_7367/m.19113 type:complete len:652 (-) Transcript_7367:70-2025(-)
MNGQSVHSLPSMLIEAARQAQVTGTLPPMPTPGSQLLSPPQSQGVGLPPPFHMHMPWAPHVGATSNTGPLAQHELPFPAMNGFPSQMLHADEAPFTERARSTDEHSIVSHGLGKIDISGREGPTSAENIFLDERAALRALDQVRELSQQQGVPEDVQLKSLYLTPLCKEMLKQVSISEATQEERRSWPRLLQTLRQLITPHFQGSELFAFGSTKSNLSSRGCDVDLCLMVPQQVVSPEDVRIPKKRKHKNHKIKTEEQDCADGSTPGALGQNKGEEACLDVDEEEEEESEDDSWKHAKDGRLTARGAVAMIGELLVGAGEVNSIPTARVPIVKFKDSETGLSCDICVNNALGLINTELLRAYTSIDCRVRYLAMVVKRWAKARRLNEPFRGGLSSYGYVLLVIFFCQVRQPPTLPRLQLSGRPPIPLPSLSSEEKAWLDAKKQEELKRRQEREAKRKEREEAEAAGEEYIEKQAVTRDGETKKFGEDDSGLKSDLLGASRLIRKVPLRERDTYIRSDWSAYNTSSSRTSNGNIGQLLEQFFAFFAYDFDYKNGVVSVKYGEVLSKECKGWTFRDGRDHHLFCIEDPFETEVNLGKNMTGASVQDFRDELRRAVKMTRSFIRGGYKGRLISRLCEERDEQELAQKLKDKRKS